jgi:uncharacterized iron-regulated membrane protein
MDKQGHVQLLRSVRKIHRTLGIFLFCFFIIIGSTGLLLGIKKNSGGLILAPTQEGSRKDLKSWLTIDSIVTIGQQEMRRQGLHDQIERIDVRPKNGVVKMSFSGHYTGVQIDGATGKILSQEIRRSDWIEHLHDGSFIDHTLGWKSGQFKLVYTVVMGLALITFSLTGFWLWYGPRKVKSTTANV